MICIYTCNIYIICVYMQYYTIYIYIYIYHFVYPTKIYISIWVHGPFFFPMKWAKESDFGQKTTRRGLQFSSTSCPIFNKF